MKVLFIGGDREIAYMTSKILTRNQCEVSTAVGAQETAEILAVDSFDLVVLDCDMNESDYISIIQNVKQLPHSPPLLSISDNRESEVPLLKAGADDWMLKPYHMNVLLARMAALLRQKRKHED